jgi:prophage antirepressor-like protein
MAAPAIQTTVTVTFKLRGGAPSPIRLFARGGRPWIVASDVCRIIGIRTDAVSRLLPEQFRSHATVLTKGMVQSVTAITDEGFGLLVMESTKPAAKALREWIAAEVLPSVLKLGGSDAPKPTSDQSPR